MEFPKKEFCPVCQSSKGFKSYGDWHRDYLVCQTCGSIPRERALSLVLEREFPNWRALSIHESSPSNRSISLKLKTESSDYIESQYFGDEHLEHVNGILNINLEKMHFPDETHDLFICLDVLEHVFNPQKAIVEIWRTLKQAGVGIMTFPIQKNQTEPIIPRAKVNDGGVVQYLSEPQYHGNPINPEGSLVTVDYGYDIHQVFGEWAPFDVEVIRFASTTHGIIGEFTEVVVLRKHSGIGAEE